MSSTRLPGKVLYEFDDGEEVLWKVYCQIKNIEYFDEIVVLTSSEESDDKIELFCRERKISYFRGPLDDVYSRFCSGLDIFPCDGFVRICADSPFVNESLLNYAVKIFLEQEDCFYVANTLERSFPKGLSVQISDTKEFLSSRYMLSESFSSEHICNGFESLIYKSKRINILTTQLFKKDSFEIDEKEDLKLLSLNPKVKLEQSSFYYERI